MGNVTLLAAFLAGVLSFISPCVLPLIPGYLSFVSGVTLEEMRGNGALAAPAPGARRKAVIASIAFVLGFSLVFVSLGASATAVGAYLMTRLALLGKAAGIIIILFGLHMMGLLRIGWLYSEKRVQTAKKPAGFFGAMVVGVAFAFGWTPCIGPILAAILAIAAAQESVWQGVKLLAVYSLGLGVPFIATSLAINQFFAASARLRKHYHAIEMVSGVLLVVVGVLIFTNRFTIIAQYLSPFLPTF
jgi:cytochrome c-type biogenesis protein